MARIIRANARLIAVAVACAVLVAIAYMVATPTAYTATSSVVVDVRGSAAPTDPDTPLASGVQDLAMVETQMRVITSTDVLARVVDAEKLVDDPDFQASDGVLSRLFGRSGTGDGEDRRDAAIEALGRSIVVRHAQNNYVLDIQVSARRPQLAQHLADAVARAYIQDLQAIRQKTAQGNLAIVNSRYEILRQRVEEAARRVADFKTSNGITDANGRNVLEQQLSNAVDDLTRANDRMATAKARYDQIVRLRRAGLPADAVGDAMKSPALDRLYGQLADLQRQRANLATTLGEKHPAMQEIEAQIRDMRKLVAQEVERIAASASNEYQVARDTDAQASQRVDQLRKAVEQRGTTMAQLQILQREADTTRAAFERYQRVRDAASEGPAPVVARLIAPATLPIGPSAPKKKIALIAALFGGLFLGVLIALTKDYLTVPGAVRAADAKAPSRAPAPVAPVPVAAAAALAQAEPEADAPEAAEPATPASGPETVAEAESLDSDDLEAGRLPRVMIELPRNRPPARRRRVPSFTEADAGGAGLGRESQGTHRLDAFEAGAPYLDRIAQLWGQLRRQGAGTPGRRRILVTSFEPGCGKTMLSLALSRAAAADGLSTLLVEANTERPVIADTLPAGSRPGLVGSDANPRVGFLLKREGQADLCIVPLIEDEDVAISELQARNAAAQFADMPTRAAVTIFDGGTMEDDETRELARKADLVLILVGPSRRSWLSDEDPAAELRVARSRIAGYVGSPVELGA